MTFLAGNAAYVRHAGPAISRRRCGRHLPDLGHAHFDELPSFKSIAAALGEAKSPYRRGSQTGRVTRRTRRQRRCTVSMDSIRCPEDSNSSRSAIVMKEPIALRARHDVSIVVIKMSQDSS